MRLPDCLHKSRLLYEGPIRSGRFGDYTKEPFKVWQCDQTNLAFLDPFPTIEYTNAAYREAVNGSSAIGDYFKLHDAQQITNLSLIARLIRRGMTVADCGCGGGGLLDYLNAVSQTTIAIEPFTGYQISLTQRGHKVFSDLNAAANVYSGQVDLALSFHVIEHTSDPINYMRGIYQLLKPGGKAFVLTPNLNDILFNLDFESFAPFFFRFVHNYYFNHFSLAWVAEQAGFVVEEQVHSHEFGLANAFLWVKESAPTEFTKIKGINQRADTFWKQYLEETGQANTVAIISGKHKED